MARFLMLTNFGKVDGWQEDVTTPNWLLGEEARDRIRSRKVGDRGLKPDMVVLEGWPDNVGAPTGLVKEWRGENGLTQGKLWYTSWN